MEKIMTKKWQSPIGEMVIGSIGDKLCLADWARSPKRELIDRKICNGLMAQFHEGISFVIERTINQLEEYFGGQRRDFDLPLRMIGTEFQLKVWKILQEIPYGATITYSEQATRMGCPKAVRAVASANGSNPITIIVPCHRVIGTNHSLTGYTGGLDIKEALLKLESKLPAQLF